MASKLDDFIRPFIVPSGKTVSLDEYDPAYSAEYVDKQSAKEMLEEGVAELTAYQDKLYAANKHALLIILQALDAAGKDSVIKHVMSGLNPQGTQVYSFKAPSQEELDHDYLWRNFKALPERGRIGIFNRSYYEEVIVVRVHRELLANENLPEEAMDKKIWKRRFEEINNFEKYLVDNGIHVLKFFLNVSKEEQKKRFLERIERPEKNWKFSLADVDERRCWDQYRKAFQDMLDHTGTDWAPWHVIPADKKWFTRLAVASVIIAKFKEIDPQYPTISDEQKAQLLKAKELLLEEDKE